MDLKNLPIRELVKNKPNCFSFLTSASIRDVMKEMSARNFLSLPLRDNTGRYVGITNIVDISCFILGFILGQENESKSEAEIERIAAEKLNWDIGCCLGLSEESKVLWFFSPETPIWKILEVFHKGIHRVLVSLEGQTSVKILTQTDILRFLNQNLDKWGALSNMPVLKPLEEGEKTPLFSFSEERQVFHAFNHMMSRGVRALPIVNRNGQVVGSLFQSDLRGLMPTNVKNLLLPIKDFLRLLNRPAETPMITRSDITIRECLDIFLKWNILALWAVDGEMKPVRAISASDIIQRFAPY